MKKKRPQNTPTAKQPDDDAPTYSLVLYSFIIYTCTCTLKKSQYFIGD